MADETADETKPGESAIPVTDPFALFDEWMAEARDSEPNDFNAMALATAAPDGAPSVRMVLLKGHGPDVGGPGGGFTFYTNAHSRKGKEIRANDHVALLFHWKSLRRQIRIEGKLSEVDPQTATDYFHSRSRDSQLGAVASEQSSPLEDRQTFLDRFRAVEKQFEGRDVDRPEHWTGFTVTPQAIEFWLDRPNRLHDRRVFTRAGDGWTDTLLYP